MTAETVLIWRTPAEYAEADDSLILATVPRRTLKDRVLAAWRRHGR